MNGAKLFGGAAIAMVVAAAIGGLMLAGSPGKERERRFDDTRVNNLQQIASAIDLYVATSGTLPASLDELVKPETARLYYISSIKDPETSQQYEYSVTGGLSYKLCATFTHASDDTSEASRPVMMDPYTKIWEHPAGAHCFDLVSPAKTAVMPPAVPAPMPVPVK